MKDRITKIISVFQVAIVLLCFLAGCKSPYSEQDIAKSFANHYAPNYQLFEDYLPNGYYYYSSINYGEYRVSIIIHRNFENSSLSVSRKSIESSGTSVEWEHVKDFDLFQCDDEGVNIGDSSGAILVLPYQFFNIDDFYAKQYSYTHMERSVRVNGTLYHPEILAEYMILLKDTLTDVDSELDSMLSFDKYIDDAFYVYSAAYPVEGKSNSFRLQLFADSFDGIPILVEGIMHE